MAKGVTKFWLAAVALLVVVPLVLTRTAPGLTTVAWLAAGLGAVVLVWWLLIRRLRARQTRGKRLDELRAMTPTDFEYWVGARFAEEGWDVEHTGGFGDHGIDLKMRREGGETAVVQVKKYEGTVGEGVVRELLGSVTATGATRGYLVTTGWLTEAARTYAAALPQLEAREAGEVAALSTGETGPTATGAPACAACGAAMVERKARRTGERFLGCTRFPTCRRTMPLTVP